MSISEQHFDSYYNISKKNEEKINATITTANFITKQYYYHSLVQHQRKA